MSNESQSEEKTSEKKVFKFGPLRGCSDFFYDHVPRCQDDPNCFRMTCGSCHPQRDSQNTYWSWVYPLEPLFGVDLTDGNGDSKGSEKKLVPPILFGKNYSFLEPSEETFPPNLTLDFLDSQSDDPWKFTSSDLKGESDGSSWDKAEEKTQSSLPKKVKSQKNEFKVLYVPMLHYLSQMN